MALIIDSHCHLSSSDYNEEEIATIIDEAKLSGVKYFFDVGYSITSSERISHNILSYENTYGIIGIHPDEVNDVSNLDLKQIQTLASENNKIIGIGEIGLDYYHSYGNKNDQKKMFISQLKIAKKLKLPVSIHVRDEKNVYGAYDDCLDILKKQNITKGVMHCHSGTYQLAHKFIELGFYISISGIVTFKNAKTVQEVVKKISIENLLVETDAPYLSPEPYRGNKNLPKYIIYTIKKIASIKSLPTQVVIKELYNNTVKLFGIK